MNREIMVKERFIDKTSEPKREVDHPKPKAKKK